MSLAYLFFVPRRYKIPFLTMAIITPPIIVFSPIATFLMFIGVPQDTWWRFFYMVPIGIVGAYLFVLVAYYYRAKPLTILLSGIVIILPLFPIKGLTNIQNLRLTTLSQIDSRLTSNHWSDLFHQLNLIGDRNVLTDPVTCYLVNAITYSKCFGFKFHGSKDFIPINYNYYGHKHFSDFHEWLLIVNRRDGIASINGKISGHWPENIMKVSDYYSDLLLSYLEGSPQHIQKLWELNDITIYEIE